jgi:hypothetical protein
MTGGIATTYSVDEMEAAWEEFQRLGARGRDWPAWANLFTDDALYIEHCIGRFHGSSGVLAFILDAMEPVAPMTFSVDWAIIDPPYLAFDIWNHMPDPGDGQRYSFSNLTVLEYAGGGKWRLEEDFYSPKDSGRAVMRWFRAGGTPDMPPDPGITHTSLVAEPTTDDRDGVAAMVASWRTGQPRYSDGAEVWVHGSVCGPAHNAAAFDEPADVVVMDGKHAFLRCGATGVALTHGGEGTIRFEERAANPDEHFAAVP